MMGTRSHAGQFRNACLGLILSSSAVLAQSGTVTFTGGNHSNLGTILHDGTHSNDIAGIQLDIFGAKTAADAQGRIATGSFPLFSDPDEVQQAYPIVIPIDVSFGYTTSDEDNLPRILVVMSHDSSAFDFQGIYVNDYIDSDSPIIFEGFRRGISTGTVSLPIGAANNYQMTFTHANGLTDSIFRNVDEVRISNGNHTDGKTWGIYAGFNNISIGPAVAPPTVTTGKASSVTTTDEMVSGTVNANGSSTTDSIQYGPSTSYGKTVAASPATATGTSATSITATLYGLSAGTTYHYRVKAVNAGGTSYGADSTFTIAKMPQVISVMTSDMGTYADTLALSATASSGMPVAWTSSDTTAVKILSASRALLRKVGVVQLTASQAGNGNFAAASVVWNLTVYGRTLTVTGVTASDKVYDGTTAAVVSGGSFGNVVAGDSVRLVLGTANFVSKDTGTGKKVSLLGCTVAGKDSANYRVRMFYYSDSSGNYSTQQLLTASIKARPLLVRADSIRWDLGASASAPSLTFTDTGLVSGDVLSGSLQRESGDRVGRYAITRGTLSAGPNYDLSFLGASFVIVDSRTTALAIPSVRIRASHEIAASVGHSFGSLAQGAGAARIGTDLDGTSQSVDVLLPSAGEVRVDIYDNQGTRVISWSRDVDEYALSSLRSTSDGRRVLPVAWNGRASDGTAVSAGVYLWKIEVRTADGRKLETVRKLGLK